MLPVRLIQIGLLLLLGALLYVILLTLISWGNSFKLVRRTTKSSKQNLVKPSMIVFVYLIALIVIVTVSFTIIKYYIFSK